MDVGELVKNALAAKQQGVPVNWEELCITVLNAAVRRVTELEKELAAHADTQD